MVEAELAEAVHALNVQRYHRGQAQRKLRKYAQRPRLELLIVESTTACDLCGKPVFAGSEAARGAGRSIQHVFCRQFSGWSAGGR